MQLRTLPVMVRAGLSALAFGIASLSSSGVNAHATSTAYLEVGESAAGTPTLQWRIALRDLDALLDLDANSDGQLLWGEVVDRAKDIDALAASAITVKSGANVCTLRFNQPRYVRITDAGYAQLDAAPVCDASGTLTLAYRLFESVDPSHRVLLTMRGVSEPRIVAPGATVTLTAANRATEARSNFAGFLFSGIAHIAGGYDHVLFLLCLLLPAVLQRSDEARRWVGSENPTSALVAVIWIATAFTIAHSLTLALATFGVIRLSASVIEPLIALTILATALNNVWPVVTRRLAVVAFFFGLIHGFGFAEVLAPLSLPRSELGWGLLAFNLGVEVGQLVIVAGAFLVLVTLRRWTGYARWVLSFGSMLIAIVATLWFIERAFDVPVLG